MKMKILIMQIREEEDQRMTMREEVINAELVENAIYLILHFTLI